MEEDSAPRANLFDDVEDSEIPKEKKTALKGDLFSLSDDEMEVSRAQWRSSKQARLESTK